MTYFASKKNELEKAVAAVTNLSDLLPFLKMLPLDSLKNQILQQLKSSALIIEDEQLLKLYYQLISIHQWCPIDILQQILSFLSFDQTCTFSRVSSTFKTACFRANISSNKCQSVIFSNNLRLDLQYLTIGATFQYDSKYDCLTVGGRMVALNHNAKLFIKKHWRNVKQLTLKSISIDTLSDLLDTRDPTLQNNVVNQEMHMVTRKKFREMEKQSSDIDHDSEISVSHSDSDSESNTPSLTIETQTNKPLSFKNIQILTYQDELAVIDLQYLSKFKNLKVICIPYHCNVWNVLVDNCPLLSIMTITSSTNILYSNNDNIIINCSFHESDTLQILNLQSNNRCDYEPLSEIISIDVRVLNQLMKAAPNLVHLTLAMNIACNTHGRNDSLSSISAQFPNTLRSLSITDAICGQAETHNNTNPIEFNFENCSHLSYVKLDISIEEMMNYSLLYSLLANPFVKIFHFQNLLLLEEIGARDDIVDDNQDDDDDNMATGEYTNWLQTEFIPKCVESVKIRQNLRNLFGIDKIKNDKDKTEHEPINILIDDDCYESDSVLTLILQMFDADDEQPNVLQSDSFEPFECKLSDYYVSNSDLLWLRVWQEFCEGKDKAELSSWVEQVLNHYHCHLQL